MWAMILAITRPAFEGIGTDRVQIIEPTSPSPTAYNPSVWPTPLAAPSGSRQPSPSASPLSPRPSVVPRATATPAPTRDPLPSVRLPEPTTPVVPTEAPEVPLPSLPVLPKLPDASIDVCGVLDSPLICDD